MTPSIHKINRFRFRSRIAAFDYDWTLVKPKSGKTFPNDEKDWEWFRESVPATLKNLYEKGYAILIFTNQSKGWKQTQILDVLNTLGIPILVAIAFEESDKKPSDALWRAAVSKGKCKKEASFFVGDALGRPGDWSDIDKKFAESVGIACKAPEDVFSVPEILPLESREIVVFVGYPGSGKTTAANKAFEYVNDYVILRGDDYKTSARLLKAAETGISQGKSVVIDATNPSSEKRKPYLELAKKHGLRARCVHASANLETSYARNKTRPVDKMVPMIAYRIYSKKFEPPRTSEGFESVIAI